MEHHAPGVDAAVRAGGRPPVDLRRRLRQRVTCDPDAAWRETVLVNFSSKGVLV